MVCKGGKKESLAMHQQTAQRIRDYLAVAGHGEDLEGPLFRPVRGNPEGQEAALFRRCCAARLSRLPQHTGAAASAAREGWPPARTGGAGGGAAGVAAHKGLLFFLSI